MPSRDVIAAALEVLLDGLGDQRLEHDCIGHPLFVETTLEALKSWKYAPSNSETNVVLEFNFNLSDGRALVK